MARLLVRVDSRAVERAFEPRRELLVAQPDAAARSAELDSELA